MGELNTTVAIPLSEICLILTCNVALGYFFITSMVWVFAYLVTLDDVVFVSFKVVLFDGGSGLIIIENEYEDVSNPAGLSSLTVIVTL
jgi:hypothetical protein